MAVDIGLQEFRRPVHPQSPVDPTHRTSYYRSSFDHPEEQEPPEEHNPDEDFQKLLQDIDDETLPKATWLSLFSFTKRKHWPILTLSLFLSASSGLIIPIMSILLGQTFGAFASLGSGAMTTEEFMKKITTGVIQMSALGFAGWIFHGGFFAAWLYFGELQAKTVREMLFEGLIFKELAWYENRKNGLSALLSKCQTQIRELQISVSQPLGYVAQSIITAVTSLGVAFYHSWALTFVILAGVPICLLVVAFLSTRMQKHIDRQKENLEQASKSASRAIVCIETVKVLNGQDQEENTFAEAIYKAAAAYRKQAVFNATQTGLIRFLSLAMFVQGFWYGSYLLKQAGEKADPASIMTTFWSCLMATQALEIIMPQLLLLEKGRAAGAGLLALLGKFKTEHDKGHMRGGRNPSTCHGEIQMKSVYFSYPSRPEELVLKDITLTMPANETTFVIGRSGSGKSTLGNLIMNAYRANYGEVSIDGNPTTILDPRWVRDHVSLVEAKSVLFNETIFRNVSFGRMLYEGVTRGEVYNACETAAMEEMLDDLSMGLDTIVGIGGRSLSGGQLQRVALARDRLRDATILILDESLSAVDRRTRFLILNRIREWRKNKTTIVITHEITDIQETDFVYVMEHGRIAQKGYRKELDDIEGPLNDFINAGQTIQNNGSPLQLIPELNNEFWANSGFNGSSLGAKIQIEPEPPRPPKDTRKRKSIYTYGASSQFSEDASNLEMPGLPGRTRRLSMHRRSVQGQNLAACGGRISEEQARETEGGRRSVTPEKPVHRKLLRTSNKNKMSSPPVIPLKPIFGTVWAALDNKMRCLLVLGFTFALFHAAATPVFSFALSRLLASVLDTRKNEDDERAKQWSLIILGIAFIDTFSLFSMHYLLELCGQAWVDRLRIQALSKVLSQSRAWFDRERNSAGRLVEDLEKNAEEMRNLLGRFAGYTVVGFFMTIIGVGWSFTVSWRLTFMGVIIAPVMYGISRGLNWASDRWEGKCNQAAENTGSILNEAITSIRTVRNFVLEQYFRIKYFEAIQTGVRLGVKRSATEGFGFGLSDSAILFATAIIFYYGALLVSQGKETLEDVMGVFSLLLFSLSSANAVISMIPQLSNSKDSARRILRLSNLSRKTHESDGDKQLTSATGSISFRNISFSYPSRPTRPVLDNLTLHIPAGSFIALTGSSGCGKSTLASLLLRLYPPSSGTITLSSTPVPLVSITSLRSTISIVPQTPVLFPLSIFDNITYGCTPTPTISAVYEAAKSAGCHEFIMDLQNGYGTMLGDSGMGLSTGQGQRVAIARALVRAPRVLVLDEATSGLDARSARGIREMVAGMRGRGVTVVCATHKVELMKAAERVVVLRGGRVVEDGSWEEVKGGVEMGRVLGEAEAM